MNEVTTVEHAPISELPDAELMTQLAMVKAMKDVLVKKYEELRHEAGERLRKINQAFGANSFDLKIGDAKVGKASFAKASIGTDVLGEYDKWAWDTHRGTRELNIDLTSHRIPDEAIWEIFEIAKAYGADTCLKYKAFPELTRSLKVKNGVVVDENGEVVPGAYIKVPQVSITGCKPQDVGEAMRLSGDDYLVSGLLEA